MYHDIIEIEFYPGPPLIRLVQIATGKLWFAAGVVSGHPLNAYGDPKETRFAVATGASDVPGISKYTGPAVQCRRALIDSELNPLATDLLMDLATVLTPISPEEKAKDAVNLASQHTTGQYREEVDKIVDGVLEDIRSGHVTSQWQAMYQALDAVNRSDYATDLELACAALQTRGTETWSGPVVLATARAAMAEDVKKTIEQRQPYYHLPRRDDD